MKYVCGKIGLLTAGELFRPKRLVYRAPSTPPSREEIIEEEIRAGVGVERRQIEGFYLTHPPNPQLEAVRLGVREEISDVLQQQGTNVETGILQERVTQQLRLSVGQRVERAERQRGWFGQKFHAVGGLLNDLTNPFRSAGRFFGNLRHPGNIRYDTAHERHIAREMEQEYGQSRNIPDMVAHVVDEIRDVTIANIIRMSSNNPVTGANMAFIRNQLMTLPLDAMEYLGVDNDINRDPAFQRLITLRRIEAQERSKILSINMFDPTRLTEFYERIKSDDQIAQLMQQILEPNALSDLYHNHPAQALLAQLMFLYENNGNSLDLIRNSLTGIRDRLPAKKGAKPVENEEKPENEKNIEKVDEAQTKYLAHIPKLQHGYSKAQPIARRIARIQSDIARHEGPNPPPMDAKGRGLLLQQLRAQLDKLEDSRTNTLSEVNQLESDYKELANELVASVLKSRNQTAAPGGTSLANIVAGANLDLSTESELFRMVPPGGAAASNASALETHAGTLNRTFLNALNEQIDRDYKQTIRGRQQINSRHLLTLLKDESLEIQGVLDPDRRMRMASFSANLMVADAGSVDLYRSGNREIAESLIGGWRGRMRRARQSIASKFFNSDTFTARDIIEHVAGLDHAFAVFKDLKPDASLADVRRHVLSHGNISTDKLREFYTYLKEALQSFKAGENRAVEIEDVGWPIETLVHNLTTIHSELETRDFCQKIANPETPEDKKLSKAEYLAKLMKEKEENEKAFEKSMLEKIRSEEGLFKISFVRSVVKEKFGELYEKLKNEAAEKGLTGEKLEQYYEQGGLPPTILKILQRGEAAKGALETAGKAGLWAGTKLGKAAGAAAKFGYEKGKTVLGATWKHLGKPGLKATGRGALKTAKFGFVTTPKFLFWQAPKWTVTKIAKGLWWPFKMVGKGTKGFWNLFSYSPEKAAADAEWYAHRKAQKASGHKAPAVGAAHGGSEQAAH